MEEYRYIIEEFARILKTSKPAISGALGALKEYGPEVYDLVESLVNASTDLKANAVKRFEKKHGFSREDAIILTSSQLEEVYRAINKRK